VAGLNAARAAGGADPVSFGRDEAYIGVMIDDLVTRGVSEPYRMFTSRAEFRLTLRADNADQRLTGRGIDLGLVGSERAAVFHVKLSALQVARTEALTLSVTPNEAVKAGLRVNEDGQRRNLTQLLAYPEIGWSDVAGLWPQIQAWPEAVREQIEIDAAYAGYLDRQQAEVDAFRRDEALSLPSDLDYAEVAGLSNEARQKLSAVRPQTLGQASRIEGITPGAVTTLLAHVRRSAKAA
jgi:tRNA uridine 5-carboxymethylaminomethyl modification enzyme